MEQGFQPAGAEFWLFLDLEPYRTNGLAIASDRLPTERDCRAVAGLDIVVVFKGNQMTYRTLLRLCESLLAARPRRLLAFDLDYKKMAYLKHGAFPC